MAQKRGNVFQDDKGNPVVFFFRPCAARSKVQPIIEEHGGQVTARRAFNAIKLANDDDYLVSDDYYSVRYIEDCVKANEMLDKEKYRLQPRKVVIRDASEDQVSDISFDEDEPQRLRASLKYFQGRKMYTYADDMAILNYIISNDLHDKVAGNAVWKEMENLEITRHSASSMNTRYRKIIKLNLNLYTIPVTHKKKLNLDYMATSDDTDSSTEKRRPIVNSKKDEITFKSPSKASSPKDSKLTKHVDDGHQNRKGSVNSSKSAPNSKSPKKTTRSQKSEDLSDYSDDSSAVSDSVPVNIRRKKRKLDFVTSTKHQTSKSDKQEKSSNSGTPQKSEIVKNSEDEENTESPNSKFTRGKGRPRKTKLSVGTPSKSPTKSKDPKKVLETNKNTTMDGSPKANGKDTRITSHSLKPHLPSQQAQRTLYNTEGFTLTPGQIQNTLNSSNAEEHNTSVSSVFKPSYGDSPRSKRGPKMKRSKTQSPYSKNVQRLDDSVDDDELEDDFDKELMRRVATTSTQASDDEVQTPSKMKRSRLPTGKHSSDDSQKITSRKQSKISEGTPIKKSQKMKKRSSQTAYVTVFTDDEEEIVTEVAPESTMTENRLDDAETKELILNLCEEYQLTVAQVRYVIYINNGDVNDTMEWLGTSGECNGKMTWDIQDDEKLDGNLDELFRKYGESTVRNRISFLEQL